MVTKLIKYIVVFIGLMIFSAPVGKSSQLNRHKMVKKLIKLYNRRLNDKEASNIAAAALKVNSKGDCKVSWDLIVSIAIVESALNSKAYNRSTQDYGIMQINEKMIKRLNLNKSRLMKDVHYSFDSACKIITENKDKYSAKRPYWIGLYNSGVAFHKPIVIKNAKKYDQKIKSLLTDIHTKYVKLYESEN